MLDYYGLTLLETSEFWKTAGTGHGTHVKSRRTKNERRRCLESLLLCQLKLHTCAASGVKIGLVGPLRVGCT